MAPLDRYTTSEIAKQIGIGQSTARKWASEYKIPSLKIKGKPVYQAEIAEVFKIIQELKGAGRSDTTIRRTISETIPDSAIAPPQHRQEAHSVDIAALERIIEGAITKSEGIAEKYARATHEIGVLQERCRQLEEQVKALPPPETRYQLELQTTESERLLSELEQKTSEAEQLAAALASIEAENQELKSKLSGGFWAKLKMLFAR